MKHGIFGFAAVGLFGIMVAQAISALDREGMRVVSSDEAAGIRAASSACYNEVDYAGGEQCVLRCEGGDHSCQTPFFIRPRVNGTGGHLVLSKCSDEERDYGKYVAGGCSWVIDDPIDDPGLPVDP